MHRKLLTALATGAIALGASGCSEKPPAQPTESVGTADNWTAVGGAADESSYSQLDQINTGNAGDLGLAWALDLPDEVTLEAAPLAIDGTIYFSGSYAAVYAVDAETGKLKWRFDPETWKHSPQKMYYSFGANRGVAYEDGRIFVAALDCRLIALDAQSGEELWVAETATPESFNICTGAPRVMNGKVIIGNGGADFGARGYVTTYDAKTGKQLWRFYTVPGSPEQNKGNPAMELAAETWGEDFWKTTGGGGTVWNGITFDPEKNRVYIGVGNTGPYDPAVRDPGGGDNLFTVSTVALDADTGEYLWHYQHNPREAWDFKSTANMIVATLDIDGEPRDVLMQAPTNGFFYVLDRDTGKLVNEPGKTTVITWADRIDVETGRPVEKPNIRYESGDTEIWPSTVGGHNWQPMSYNPRLGLVYIPVHQLGAYFKKIDDPTAAPDDGFNVMGLVTGSLKKKPGDGHGYLVAWDPVAQKEAWRIKHDYLWNGGTLTTAGGLVFQGTADGRFDAYNGRTGERLWRFDAKLGIIGAPITYSLGGKQYVSILVGYGGTSAAFGKYMDVGWKYGAQPRRLLTFALDGKGELPDSPGPTFEVNALDDPELVLDEADVAAGRALSVRCAACHGVGMYATGTPGPDLRESAIALRLDTFTQLVVEGRMEKGMPKFDMLSEDEIRQLHAYVRARAREVLGKREGTDDSAPRPLL